MKDGEAQDEVLMKTLYVEYVTLSYLEKSYGCLQCFDSFKEFSQGMPLRLCNISCLSSSLFTSLDMLFIDIYVNCATPLCPIYDEVRLVHDVETFNDQGSHSQTSILCTADCHV